MSYPRTRGIALSASFAVLLSISSIVNIPLDFITPVPITLQVLFVLLTMAILGPVYGTLTCVLYLVLGAVGLPVYAGATSGLPVLLGPNGGYLFSFPVATLVGGMICSLRSANRSLDSIRIMGASLVAIAIIYSIGIIWLSDYLHISLWTGLVLGGLPFIPFDLLKLLVAAQVSLQVRRSVNSLPIRHRDGAPKSQMRASVPSG